MPKLNPFVLADLFQGLTRFERLARTVPLDEPWTATGAATLDGQTLDTWIRRNLRTPLGRAYFRIATEAVYAAEPTDLSVLHAAFYTHSGTDFETLLSVDGGAQQDRVVGGSSLISERMAARARRPGAAVVRRPHDRPRCLGRSRQHPDGRVVRR